MSQSEPDWKSTSPQAIHERKVVLQRRSLFVYVPFSLVTEAIQMIAHVTDREEGDLEFLKGGNKSRPVYSLPSSKEFQGPVL